MNKMVIRTGMVLGILFLTVFGLLLFTACSSDEKTAKTASELPESMDDLITYSVPEGANLEFVTTASGEFYTPDKNTDEPVIGKEYSFSDGGYFVIDIFTYRGYVQGGYEEDGRVDYRDYYDFEHNTDILKTDFGTVYVQSLISDDVPDMVLRAVVENGDYVYEMTLTNSDEQYTSEQKEWFYEFLKNLKVK